MNDTAIFTISSLNYFAFAKTMLGSVKELHDDIDLFYVLADEEEDGDCLKNNEGFEVVFAKDLDISDFEKISFAYNIIEFNTSIKPFFIRYLFDKGYKKVLYVDPDILVVNRLDYAINALGKYSFVVTPHQLTPVHDVDKFTPYLQWEQSCLQTGIFNLGFLGISNTGEGNEFIRWWSNRCNYFCFDSQEAGLFVDQKWVDLMVCYFKSFLILRHKGYNMSVWNLHDRALIENYVNGDEPLVFYHFSSVDIDDLSIISKHDKSIKLKSRPDLESLFAAYQTAVKSNGHEYFRSRPYAYDFYNDGRSVSLLDRRLFLAVADDFPHPFQSTGRQFYKALKRKQRIRNTPPAQSSGLSEKLFLLREVISKLIEPLNYFRLMRTHDNRKQINSSTFLNGL